MMVGRQTMDDEVKEFRITAIRSPGLTDEEIQRRWKLVFDRILAFDLPKDVQEVASRESKPKPPDTIPLANDLLLEVDDDHLILRRGKDAIVINPDEVRALLDGLIDAASKLASRQLQPSSESMKTAMCESMPVHHTDSVKADSFFSSALYWLEKIQEISADELETLKQEAEANFTGQQRKAFATAYCLYCRFGP
jgi:hypothetical protein